jgi:hypothetical protein
MIRLKTNATTRISPQAIDKPMDDPSKKRNSKKETGRTTEVVKEKCRGDMPIRGLPYHKPSIILSVVLGALHRTFGRELVSPGHGKRHGTCAAQERVVLRSIVFP